MQQKRVDQRTATVGKRRHSDAVGAGATGRCLGRSRQDQRPRHNHRSQAQCPGKCVYLVRRIGIFSRYLPRDTRAQWPVLEFK